MRALAFFALLALAAAAETPLPDGAVRRLEHGVPVRAVAISRDGRRLATAGDGGEIRVWDATTGAQERAFGGGGGAVNALSFSRGGGTLASGGEDGELRRWNPATGAARRGAKAARISAIAHDPRNEFLAWCGAKNIVTILDLPGCEPDEWYALWPEAWGGGGHEIRSLAYSPDGWWIAASARGALRLWDIAGSDTLLRVEDPESDFASVAISPDRQLVAAGLTSGEVRVWEVVSGKVALSLKGAKRDLWALAFAPDGRALAAAGEDAILRLWDLDSGGEAVPLKGHAAAIRALAFAPDGETVTTASLDGSALVWNARLEREPIRAPRREEMPALWEKLGDADAGRAFRAVLPLAAAGEPGAVFIGEQFDASLRPARTEELIRALDAEDTAVRAAAVAELARLGPRAEPAVRAALENPASPEAAGRLRDALAAMESAPAESPQWLRAIVVLERIGTAGARAVLTTLKKRSPSQAERRAASRALRRMGK